MERYMLAILVCNCAGVLTRVSGMFTRRGFNINSLTVGETESHEFSRITITFDGDEATKNQIVSQLGKLHDVKEIQVLDSGNSVARELLLIKVQNKTDKRQDILTIADIFRAKIIDYSDEALSCQLTGETNKIEAFIDLLRPFGIYEICRTGIVALQRGNNSLNIKKGE